MRASLPQGELPCRTPYSSAQVVSSATPSEPPAPRPIRRNMAPAAHVTQPVFLKRVTRRTWRIRHNDGSLPWGQPTSHGPAVELGFRGTWRRRKILVAVSLDLPSVQLDARVPRLGCPAVGVALGDVMPHRYWQEGPGYERNLIKRSTIVAGIDYLRHNPGRRGWGGRSWTGNGPLLDSTCCSILLNRIGLCQPLAVCRPSLSMETRDRTQHCLTSLQLHPCVFRTHRNDRTSANLRTTQPARVAWLMVAVPMITLNN